MNGYWQIKRQDSDVIPLSLFPHSFISQSSQDIYLIQTVSIKSDCNSLSLGKLFLCRHQQLNGKLVTFEAVFQNLQILKASGSAEQKNVFVVVECDPLFEKMKFRSYGPTSSDDCLEIFQLCHLNREIKIHSTISTNGRRYTCTRYLQRYTDKVPYEFVSHLGKLNLVPPIEDTSTLPQPLPCINYRIIEKKCLDVSNLDKLPLTSLKILCSCSVGAALSNVEPSNVGTAPDINSKIMECVQRYTSLYPSKPSLRLYICKIEMPEGPTWYTCYRYTQFRALYEFVKFHCRRATSASAAPNPLLSNPNGTEASGSPAKTQCFTSPTRGRKQSEGSDLSVNFSADLPSFPAKLYFSNNSQSQINIRKEKLQDFLQRLLYFQGYDSAVIAEIFMWFLEIPSRLKVHNDAVSLSKKTVPIASITPIKQRMNIQVSIPETITLNVKKPQLHEFPSMIQEQLTTTIEEEQAKIFRKKYKLVIYVFEASYKDIRWVVCHRFNDFRALHIFVSKELKRMLNEVTSSLEEQSPQGSQNATVHQAKLEFLRNLITWRTNLPLCPKKQLLSVLGNVTEERKQAMQRFIHYVISERAFYSQNISISLFAYLEFEEHIQNSGEFKRSWAELKADWKARLSSGHSYTELTMASATATSTVKPDILKNKLSFLSVMKKVRKGIASISSRRNSSNSNGQGIRGNYNPTHDDDNSDIDSNDDYDDSSTGSAAPSRRGSQQSITSLHTPSPHNNQSYNSNQRRTSGLSNMFTNSFRVSSSSNVTFSQSLSSQSRDQSDINSLSSISNDTVTNPSPSPRPTLRSRMTSLFMKQPSQTDMSQTATPREIKSTENKSKRQVVDSKPQISKPESARSVSKTEKGGSIPDESNGKSKRTVSRVETEHF